MKIPFTQYELKFNKRGIKYLSNGRLVGITEWIGDGIFTPTTPIAEEIYSTLANEFAKLDLIHVIDKKSDYRRIDDNLNYLLSERPNKYQSAFDFKFTMMYQLLKYGNALAFLERDEKGLVTAINPLNVLDYNLGQGFQVDDDLILYKIKNLKTNSIELVDYRNLIHLRLNPNNIFYGDTYAGANYTRTITDLIDAQLGSLIRELKDNGSVRGVITIGKSQQGFANATMVNQESKITKQQEIINRIKATKGGVLVLDAGEEWQSLSSPFQTTSSQDIDKYVDMLLQFNGMNKKVVNGTANDEEMDIFFSKSVMPRLEQFLDEMNYKVFTKTAISQGHRIDYYRNPFEYVSITKAIDMAYKGIQDTTTNERRRMIYKLPPIENGDVLMSNKNFEKFIDDGLGGNTDGTKN